MSYLEAILYGVVDNKKLGNFDDFKDLSDKELKVVLVLGKDTFNAMGELRRKLIGDDETFDNFLHVVRVAAELDKEASNGKDETVE